MKERPILFSGEMVRAILDGRKTQTRRVVKPQPDWRERPMNSLSSAGWHFRRGKRKGFLELSYFPDDKKFSHALAQHCPYGQPGDRLWMREAWGYKIGTAQPPPPKNREQIIYRADNPIGVGLVPWKPSIHMHRWASRIMLEITGVRVERVQDISQADAKAEGVFPYNENKMCFDQCGGLGFIEGHSYSKPFSHLWESINAKRGFGWDANPWVWVIEFKPVPGQSAQGDKQS